MRVVIALAGLLLASPAAYSAPAAEPEQATAIQPATLGSTMRVHEFDGALLAGQPAAADLVLARERGVTTVISLRRDSEPIGYDERAEAERLGLNYRSIPWGDPSELTDEVFAQVREVLSQTARPLLLHCGSGNRVGAVWIPWRVLDGGMSYEDALAEARVIGLTTPAYEEKARAYVERQQSQQK